MAEAQSVKMRQVGERRTPLLRRVRPEYEIVITDGPTEIFRGTTISPSSVLVTRGKVHATDSHDWIKAADAAYSPHTDSWVTGT